MGLVYPTQKSVDSLSLGFIGIVTVSPPVMFSLIVELVALAFVELLLPVFKYKAVAKFIPKLIGTIKITAIKNWRTRAMFFPIIGIRHYQ